MPDAAWIPTVASAGWLIVTRDRQIQHHRAELAAVRDNRAKMVALASPEALDTWAQLEIVMTQWRAINTLADRLGPFVFTATRTSLRAIDIG